MQSGPRANDLAFIQYDLDRSTLTMVRTLVLEELLIAVFDVFRESDSVADGQHDLLSLEHTEFRFWSSGNASRRLLSNNDSSLNRPKGS